MLGAATAWGQAPPAAATAPPPVTAAPTEPAPSDATATPSAEPAAEAAPVPEKPAPEPRSEPAPHVKWVDSKTDPNEKAEPEEPAAPPEEPWKLGGSHFVLSVERVTGVLAWNSKSSFPFRDSNGEARNLEAESAGVDVALLGSGGASRTVFGIPRMAFDGITSSGISIGGAVSYMLSSGGTGAAIDGQPNSQTRGLPKGATFILAPRVGIVLPTSQSAAFWLRGGFTRISAYAEGDVIVGDRVVSGTATLTAWSATLEPQFMLVAAPHVALVLGANLDVGFAGTYDADLAGHHSGINVKNSAYGGTAGLSAVF